MYEKYVFRMRCKNDIGWSLFSAASEPMRLDSRFAGEMEVERCGGLYDVPKVEQLKSAPKVVSKPRKI